MSYLSDSAVTKMVRLELRKEDIKLWKPPFTVGDTRMDEEISALALRFSAKLKFSKADVENALEYLRTFAIEKLGQNKKFKEQKIAAMRMKFSPRSAITDTVVFMESKLDNTVGSFMDAIGSKINATREEIKLIVAGKILKPDETLESQGLKHNAMVLCMVFSSLSKSKTVEIEEQMQEVKRARRGAELLSSSSSSAQAYDAQIADQNGRTIDIPPDEKAAITVALSLHEKGRNKLKEKQYSFALLFLLEADTEFRQCRAEILNLVDNFAVLCLDIAWCYLCLKNLDSLTDAKERLKTAEQFFEKSYGASLQRLMAIKGSSGHEIALFVRLYTLQGIVEYYGDNYNQSKELLTKARGYASMIMVDDTKVSEMMVLGFTAKEARLALRACNGDLDAATRHAFQKKEEKEQIKKEEKEKSRARRKERSLGICLNGDKVNVETHDKMVKDLGFDKFVAAAALRQSDNDINQAIQIIHDDIEKLDVSKVKRMTTSLLLQMAGAGLDPQTAEAAVNHYGNVEEAIQYLLDNQSTVPENWVEKLKSKNEDLNSEDKDALDDLAKDVRKSEDDYLDTTLNEEMDFIEQYLGMVNSVLLK
uniref:NEDD8 ultimate buster 1 n=1 Tax=Ciona intestinalis TaxID=7719 RepID=UPI000180BF66|nr:NEDD8 ultimate buster 1 [Ciona intestinalis]|eukprot:XP_002126619.1 NEDD8 ultimate buster 1 [Ciona intestinalis]